MVEEKAVEYDEEVLEALRKSKPIVGPLRPCIRNQRGKLLAGKHRKRVDADWPDVVKSTEDELGDELVKLHDNVQRKVPLEETEQSLLRIAELLEAKGVPFKQICVEVCKLVPFSDRYVRLLLPAKYKRDYEKSEIFPILHKGVKKKFDRVQESKRLATHLKTLEEQGKIKPLQKDEYAKTVEEMANSSLPFPECSCAGCPRYKECYGV